MKTYTADQIRTAILETHRRFGHGADNYIEPDQVEEIVRAVDDGLVRKITVTRREDGGKEE